MYINFKSKYKKFLWLIIGFLLACFYIQKVNALDSFTMGNGTVINQEYVQNLWNTYFKGKSCKDITNSSSTYPSMTKPYEDGIFNDVLISPIDNNTIYIGFFDKSQIYYFSDHAAQENFEVGNPSPDTGYDCSPSMSFNTSTNTVEFYKRNFVTTLQIPKNSSAHTCTYVDGFKKCYNNFDLIYNDKNYLSNNFNFSFGPQLPDYLNGYTKVTLPVGTQYTMISSSQITSGYVFIPIEDFNNYGGRLSYFDKDLSSQPYTSYIQDYTTTPDGLYARQYFDLSSYNGAEWVMFSKYIYLEGEDNITYDIWVPSDSYSSLVTVTPNDSGGNDFDFSYVDSNGELQADTISSVDLTPPQPLLGDMFQNFTSNDFGLTSIITAPLPLIQSLNSATCSDISLPLGIFGGVHDNRLVLPCMTPLYRNWLGDFFILYQTITTGFIAYYVGLGFFNKIKQLKDPENDKIEVVDL